VKLEILPVVGLPEVEQGDDLTSLIVQHAQLADGDVVVVAQKIVSKSEGRMVAVDPARRDEQRAEVIRSETAEVVARRGEVLIVRTHHGFVCANAGVDASNVAPDRLALLPEDADASAARLREGLRRAGFDVAVIISDTFGRPWRTGQTNVALGVAGIAPLRDYRGEKDSYGMTLEATVIAIADELAGAAELVMGKADGIPVAVVRGLTEPGEGTARDLIRIPSEDMFPTGSLETIAAPRQARAFADRHVAPDAIERALDAAASGAQMMGRPVRFESLSQNMRAAVAASSPEDRAVLEGSPVVIAVSCLDEEPASIAAGGAGAQALMLALSAQSIASCWIAVDVPREPGRYTLGCVAAGYPVG
jgi:coenzyme F420-0:L-glutamate ligase / coenzyme F420-1:gamma-L-glutamate ligase